MAEGGSMVVNEGDDALVGLPPGFRFHPTDEEIVTHYLMPKVIDRNFTASAIGEVDLNRCEPWDLHKKAKMGEKEWWFFFQRGKKYPTGMRTNRATDSGYWKATGKDKEIKKKGKSGAGKLIGMKKTLVFYKGRAPKGVKTNWVMHEFRLEGNVSCYNMSRASKEEWVVCRIVEKNSEIVKAPNLDTSHGMSRMNSFLDVDELLDGSSWLPPLMEASAPRFDSNGLVSSFTQSVKNNVTNDENYGVKRLKSLVANENYAFYYPHDQSHTLQNDYDYKNFVASPYNYNFDTNSFQVSPLIDEPQSDVTFSTNFPHLSSGSTYYMDRVGMLEEDEKAVAQCKVEPYVVNNTYQSSKISVSSHDTGISTDMTTEASSASIHDIYGYKVL